ncbi:MFS transporter [Kutzneria viridogrisea]|uniref:Major facilitator superfamily (MFS) profile domain-containing protein n=2 Tax=Kutzneria TaxID=43356 RepID=W5WFV5_9PSEU|nr:MFS transporter [Kutzneria albida]AHH97059.1 hypothetical protein KALB_3695 [Kutzneria albida DSM 43870]MBA8931971.1 MFS family permease [Kutzneria viridogrisea]
MYLASTRSPVSGRGGGQVARTVFALGLVSLITDVSSEMVSSVLPLYLVLGLGLSPWQFGFLDGVYSGVTALVRVLGGHLADRFGRLKLVAGVGYALSAVSKLGLLAAGASPVALGAVLAVDRTGKGVRTAPRDALISLSSKPESLGRAFGVHRAMDTAGALLGPLVAMGVLWVAVGRYDAVFVVSFCFAALGVLALVVTVRDHEPGQARPAPRVLLSLLRHKGLRRICACAALLGLVTISDSFLYLLLQRRWELAATYFPLLAMGTSVSYLLLAVPLGRLADRIGRWPVFLGGHLALLAALLLALGPWAGWPVLLLHGAFYAASDGVLMAATSPLLPESQRASGMAVVQTVQAAARSASSVLFGAAWTVWGPEVALAVIAVALAAAVGVTAVLRPVRGQ